MYSYPPQLGHVDDVPLGSAEWAERLGLRLMLDIQQYDSLGAVRLLPDLERLFNSPVLPWEVFPKGRPYRTPERYFAHAAGISKTDLEKLIEVQCGPQHRLTQLLKRAKAATTARKISKQEQANQRPVGTNQYSEDGGNNKNVTTTLANPKNTVAYALRKLRRNRSDIHARVLAGEISAYAGMVEAGFRKARASTKQSPLEKILRLLPQLTAKEIERLYKELAAITK